MSADKTNKLDYKTISTAAKNGGADSGDNRTLKPAAKQNREDDKFASKNLINQKPGEAKAENSSAKVSFEAVSETRKTPLPENEFQPEKFNRPEEEIAYGELKKRAKEEKKSEKDRELLSRDHWLSRNGHTATYIGVFLFTLVVYFRPYEFIPALSGFSSIAMVIAIATVLVYLPTQITVEGTLTTLSTEIKCILFISFWAVLTIPIAKSPADAWGTFNVYSKIVLIFIVMVNTLRTKARLKGLMWLAIGVGVMHSYEAVGLYRQGIFKTDGDRVNVESVGMFGNPNDLALHLAMFVPIAVILGIASKNKLSKLVYFASAGIMIAGNMVTVSRGGFMGLAAGAGVLAWKLGKKQRFKVLAISTVVGFIVLIFAPGNLGMRLLSIFNPSLDTSGSSDQRSELLKQSIIVTLRNPQGIGMGNFPIVGTHNLHTHNAYTQVSSELGLLALAAYVILMVHPLKKLAAIERRMYSAGDSSWMYYLSVGIQASIIAYMVSSFFGPVAYNWYVYYPIAYAICLRRIYQIGQAEKGMTTEKEDGLSDYFNLQRA